MKDLIKDAAHILTPNGVCIGVVNLADVRDTAAAVSYIVATICTLVITYYKLKKK